MRCVDVIRELAAPTDTRDAADLADHLSRCSSCANLARQAAQLDRLWDATRPAEPSPEVWDNLWSQVAHSLEDSTSQEVASPSSSVSWNARPSPRCSNWRAKPIRHSPARSFRSRLWQSIGCGWPCAGCRGLFGCRIDAGGSSFHQSKKLPPESGALNQTAPTAVAAPLPSVDIEAGHMVVILADPNSPSVVDRTPKAIIAGVGREYVDWYGDERSFDWSQVFNEVEFLATT